MTKFFFFLASLIFFTLSACSTEESIQRLSTNKAYFLKEWPDSSYVQAIDSIVAAEPLKKEAKEKKTNIILNANPLPMLATPKAKVPTSVQESKSTQTKQTLKKQESFTERFASAITKWQSDPQNVNLYKTVPVKNGENAIELLTRVYGKEAKKLPKFYTLSVLQSLNPGVSVDKPASGSSLKIPKL